MLARQAAQPSCQLRWCGGGALGKQPVSLTVQVARVRCGAARPFVADCRFAPAAKPFQPVRPLRLVRWLVPAPFQAERRGTVRRGRSDNRQCLSWSLTPCPTRQAGASYRAVPAWVSLQCPFQCPLRLEVEPRLVPQGPQRQSQRTPESVSRLKGLRV